MGVDKFCHCGRSRPAKRLRPLRPAGLKPFRQRAKHSKFLEGFSPLPAKSFKFRMSVKARPDFFQRRHFELENFIAVNQTFLIQRASGRSDFFKGNMLFPCPGNIFYPQIKRIPKTPAARKIRAGLLRQNRRARAQRIGKNEIALQLPRRPMRNRRTAELFLRLR